LLSPGWFVEVRVLASGMWVALLIWSGIFVRRRQFVGIMFDRSYDHYSVVRCVFRRRIFIICAVDINPIVSPVI